MHSRAKYLLLSLVLIFLSTSAFAQNLKYKLYVLKDGVKVTEALKNIHPSFFTNHQVVAEKLDPAYWTEIKKVEGNFIMKPDHFHVIELTGVKNILSLTCGFDPMLEGFVGLDAEDSWLHYDEFRNEELGRYNDGDSKGYLFKSAKEFEGKTRATTCTDRNNEAISATVTIEY